MATSESLSQQDTVMCSIDLVSIPEGGFCLDTFHQMEETGPFTLRVKPYIIRNNNGQNGYTESNIYIMMDVLKNDFIDHNIFFDWDCQVNYIDDDDFFSGSKSPHLLFHEFGSESFIEMFFLPPSHPSIISRVDKIPGTAFYIAGTAFYDNNIELISTSIVSHEMGHCLGLFHTFHHDLWQLPELVERDEEDEEDECRVRGDCVCDTPADPGLDHSVVPNGCEWDEPTPRPVDDNGHYYQPSTNNIMSYVHTGCMEEFTEGQGKRMRNVISWSDVLQKCLVEDIVIANTQVWDLNSHPSGKVRIPGDLIVESGVTLTIEGDIEVSFGQNSRMIVQPNSMVRLFGKLTNSSCAPFWQGVEVWGNRYASQYLESSKYHQGRFFGYDGAIVENAVTGFKLYGPDRYDHSGGQLYLTGVTLRNNETGVLIPRYQNYSPLVQPPGSAVRNYRSGFVKCSFINDEHYPHDGFNSFVNLIGVRGISLSGCSFINNYMPPDARHFHDFGFGIEADYSTFFVRSACNDPVMYPDVPCQSPVHSYFSGLGVGVAGRSFRFADRIFPYVVSEVTFENCYRGVLNRGISAFTLLNNTFLLGEVPDLVVSDEQIGVDLYFRTDGMEIQENNFVRTASQSNLSVLGMKFEDVGDFNNVVRRNFFDDLDVHSQIIGHNGGHVFSTERGLTFHCNFNTNSSRFDYLVCEGGSVRPNQGLPVFNVPDVNFYATGNRFSRTGTTSERDFANDGEEINYYYYPSGVNEEPLDYSTWSIDVFDTDKNACLPEYCFPPCITPAEIEVLKTQFFNDEQQLDQTLMDYEAAVNAQQDSLIERFGHQGSALRFRMDQTAFRVLQHEILDTLTYSQDSVWAWMYRMGTYPMLWSLARQKEDNELNQESDQIMEEIYAMATENNQILLDLAFNDTLDHILESDWDSLSTSDLDFLKIIVAYRTPIASARAAGPLSHHGISWMSPCIYSGQSQLISNNEEPIEDFPGITVYPNPATDHVVFEMESHSGVQPVSVSIYDAMGRHVHHHRWKEGAERYRWDASAVPAGMYIYRIHFTSGKVSSDKLILLK